MHKTTLWLLLFCNVIWAQTTEVFNPLLTNKKLYEVAKIINVEDKLLSLEEVKAIDTSRFKPLTSDNLNLGFTTSNYWVNFNLENTTNNPIVYYLETARPITNEANLYKLTDSETLLLKSGDQIPFNQRQVQHRNTVFKFKLQPNVISSFYLHLSSDGETINVPLNLYTEAQFWQVNYSQQLFLGLFYGILFLAGIVYLFFYSSLSEKTFLYYSSYVLSIAFLQGALDGFIFQYIFPEAGFFNSKAVLITALFSNFFLLKYCEYFLDIKNISKSIYKFYKGIYFVLAALFLLTLLSAKTMEWVYPISNVNGLISLLLILTTLVVLKQKNVKIDTFFFVGIFFLVIGLLGFVMNNLGILPNNFYTLNSAKFGSGLEVIFLSLSMTNLIRKLRLEKESSQQLVLNRTKEISELKSYFMSNMSHELRTPINAILGVVQTEIDTNTNATDQYQIIKNASLSLLSNVNDILDFEKIESNQLRLSIKEFNPKLLITQISNNWQAEAEKKGLNYVFEIDEEIPEIVEGDSERFVQIINNVLSNAVKFTLTGSVVFKLKCSSQPNNYSRFSIQVADTGVGMTDSVKQNVFDSFNQMRNNHKRQFGGIGLGLTIVKHLVNLHHGNIKIESQLNKGTEVYIDIPLKIISTSIHNSLDNTLSLDRKTPIKVLVVEDNLINQMVIKRLLDTQKGIEYTIVNNGKLAIEILNLKPFDVILMDLQMPVMDGYEATVHIRSGKVKSFNKNIPIIAVTADAMPNTKDKVLELGMNDFITKPIEKNQLIKAILLLSAKHNLKIA